MKYILDGYLKRYEQNNDNVEKHNHKQENNTANNNNIEQ